MIVGVNGGGKTTSLGKLYKFVSPEYLSRNSIYLLHAGTYILLYLMMVKKGINTCSGGRKDA